MAKRPPDPADPAAVTADPITADPVTADPVTADPVTADPVTAGDIAEFLTRLARQRSPALGGDPADRAELLSDKADLFARIADQHARTDPALAEQARDIAGHTRAAATSPATRPGRRTTRHREPRQDRDQPLHAEVDHGSTSAKAQPPDRSWLVRLRRDNRAVIIVTGLARPSAEHLASKINTLLCPLDTPARHAEDTDTHDTTNVNDLASPSSPRQGISLSDTAEFRRASSRSHHRTRPHPRRTDTAPQRRHRLPPPPAEPQPDPVGCIGHLGCDAVDSPDGSSNASDRRGNPGSRSDGVAVREPPPARPTSDRSG